MSPCGAPPSASFAPGRGEALPRSPGTVGRADRAPRSPPDAELAAGPGSLGLRGEKREGKERRGEARTWGQRRLPGNFAVKWRDSGKEKRPSPPPPDSVSREARRLCAQHGLLCAARPPPTPSRRGGTGGVRGADAGGPRLGWAPRPERKSRRPWRQLRGVLARTRLPRPPVTHRILARAPLLGRTGRYPGPRAPAGRRRHFQEPPPASSLPTRPGRPGEGGC